MEEQTTWKGHSFTLLVFTGIVVLCSIFFILGMLVGRTQGQNMATVAAAAEESASKSAAKADAKAEPPPLTFYESTVKKDGRPALEVPLAKPESVAPDPPEPARAKPVVPAPLKNVLNYQVGAFPKVAQAEKTLSDLEKKGFRAFILSPPGGDPKPFFRVQVGPFTDMIEAEQAKKKLESAGYQPILKK